MDEVISDFADFCGSRDLDPVAVLKVLNAEDWHLADDEQIYTTAPFNVYED